MRAILLNRFNTLHLWPDQIDRNLCQLLRRENLEPDDPRIRGLRAESHQTIQRRKGVCEFETTPESKCIAVRML